MHAVMLPTLQHPILQIHKALIPLLYRTFEQIKLAPIFAAAPLATTSTLGHLYSSLHQSVFTFVKQQYSTSTKHKPQASTQEPSIHSRLPPVLKT